MKKTLLTLTAVAAAALTTYAQGIVGFQNYTTGNAVQVNALGGAPGQGAAGAYIGANYLIQLVWAPGTLDQSQFDAAVKSSSTPVTFFGATGGSPGSDGAGLFDGGNINLGAAGPYTMIAQAWFGSFATYALAAAGGANVGQSALFTAAAAAAPAPPGDALPLSFTVQPVPEPGTLVLAGLGAASLLLFRRKK